MERKLLQITFALAGLVSAGFGLARKPIATTLSWLWLRHVGGMPQRRALT